MQILRNKSYFKYFSVGRPKYVCIFEDIVRKNIYGNFNWIALFLPPINTKFILVQNPSSHVSSNRGFDKNVCQIFPQNIDRKPLCYAFKNGT